MSLKFQVREKLEPYFFYSMKNQDNRGISRWTRVWTLDIDVWIMQNNFKYINISDRLNANV